MLAFYSRKGSPKAGLIQEVAIEAGHAVAEIPTWMGLTAKWRVKCISLTEAKDILAGCKRLEQETRRQERLQYWQRLTSLHQPSGLSVTAPPFQPWAAISMPGPAEMPCDSLEAEWRGSRSGLSPSHHSTTSPVGKIPPPMRGPYPQTSEDEAASDAGPTDYSSHKKGRRSWGNRGSRSGESSDSSHSAKSFTSSGGRRKKKDGFSSKIQIPEFGGKKGHLGDVTDAFRQWARCITYYMDYYEDSYLMPLVVSSLTGDAPVVFDWILSLNHGDPQDLTTLLQMLREHYCGSLTFREQRNTIKNLCQKPNEAAIDFLIRVGTSVSNLAKDWKDELTEGELQALQYEVSLNGVKEEIRHVLDSEMAKREGHLTPQQMYEAVKRYETYVVKIRDWMEKVQVPQSINRRLPASPRGMSLDFTRRLPLSPLLVGWMMRPTTLKVPHHQRTMTPQRLNLSIMKMRGCTSLATLRRLYRITLFCRSRWRAPCECKR